jgi:methionyl-tRNA synthetase
LTRNGQKISKSLGNVLAPEEVVSRFGVDAARYYFLREVSPVEDGDYSDQRFTERYNADLANGLGNFCARVTGLAARRVTPVRIDRKKIELVVEQKIKSTKDVLDEAMREFRFNDALAAVWELLSFGDRYVNEKKPWAKENSDEENEAALLNLLIIVQSVGVFLSPFLPATAKKISGSVVLKGKMARVQVLPPLFPRSDSTSAKK